MRDFTLQKIVILNDLATLHEVRRAMFLTQTTRHTWLDELVRGGRFDEERYLDLVSNQLYVPRCDVRRLERIPRDVLRALPPETAVEHRVIPLWISTDGDLHAVVADPTDQRALEEVEFFAGRRLMRELARPSHFNAALEHYYGVPNVLRDPYYEARVATPVGLSA